MVWKSFFLTKNNTMDSAYVTSKGQLVVHSAMHIDKLALEAEKGANANGGKAIIFNTITISDGISMGSEGMKYSLVSREVIADSIEIPKAFGTAAAWTACPSPRWGDLNRLGKR